jgi:membrane protein DedA with SNARE-associated domain
VEAKVVDWVLAVIAAGGLAGVAALMFAENLFPPIPSEVILPLAGYAAARGDLPLAGVILAATLGAVAGASVWKAAGRRIPEAGLRSWVDRHGRWLALEVRDLDRAKAFFQRWGGLAVFLGRLAPGIRTLISLPAGILRMPWARFLAWTTAGTFLWTLALTLAGVALASRHDQVAAWLDPVTEILLGLLLAAYLWRVFRRSRRRDAA